MGATIGGVAGFLVASLLFGDGKLLPALSGPSIVGVFLGGILGEPLFWIAVYLLSEDKGSQEHSQTKSGSTENVAEQVAVECPNGHGLTELWEGKQRCWKCGWTPNQSPRPAKTVGPSIDCPEGHGPTKLWEGKPRCWICGWSPSGQMEAAAKLKDGGGHRDQAETHTAPLDPKHDGEPTGKTTPSQISEEDSTIILDVSCSCGAAYRVASRFSGKTIRCKKCHAPLTIPANEP